MQNILLQSLNKGEVQELISEAVKAAMEKYISYVTIPPMKDKSVPLLSKKEAAAYLKISLPTLSKYINIGYVKAYTVAGTRMRFKPADLDKALVELRNR